MTTPKRPPRTPRPRDDVAMLAKLADEMAAVIRAYMCSWSQRCHCCAAAVKVMQRYDRHRARVDRAS